VNQRPSDKGTTCEFAKAGSVRSTRFLVERQETETMLTVTDGHANVRIGRLCKVPDYGNLRVEEPQKPLVRMALLMADVVESLP